jgi:catechol 2,3-dioxygenase-like lactoylglutathione lyase family enzyme
MEQRISLITLGVADLARSRRFYEALGWKAAAYGNESVAFFQAGGMILALWGRKDLADDAKIADDGSGFRGMSMAHNTRSKDEVDTVLAEAERAGARILRPGEAAFWGGYTAYFADPDGHLWEVAWNPDFKIDADGNVRLPR